VAKSRALEMVGDSIEALDLAESAYAQSKTDASLNSLLLRLYSTLRLFENAAPFVERLKLKSKKSSDEWRSVGLFYQGTLQNVRAVHAFRQAEISSKTSEDKADVLRDIFVLALERNDLVELDRSFTKLEQVGHDASPLFASWLSAQRHMDPDQAIALIESRLAGPADSAHDRMALLLAKGIQLARIGQHESAFASWGEARRSEKILHFNITDQMAALKKREQFYRPDHFSRLAPFGHESSAPVFIMGMPRSGTTLLEQLLKSHPSVDGVGELSRFNNLDEGMVNQYYQAPNQLEAAAQQGLLKAHGREILSVYKIIAQKKTARLTVEKTPHNFVAAGYLALVFPHAKFLHMQRHIGDCFISSYQNRLNAWHDYVNTQQSYAQAYAIQERYRSLWSERLTSRFLSVSYENLVQDTEANMRGILNFLGLPWNEACLAPFQSGSIRTLSRQQARSSVTPSSVARYKPFEHLLRPLFDTLKSALPD
jgi:tetratricopeptide (TPR) repeat protein